MPYVTSPYAPAARRRAANLVLRHGLSAAEASRQTGVHRSTIGTWVKQAGQSNSSLAGIPTQSSRPRVPGRRLDPVIVERICALRRETGRYAAALHAQLLEEDIKVSLSSVKRVIRRNGLARPLSKWRRAWKPPIKRPQPSMPGALVQMDTVHIARRDGSKYYLFTVIDVCSRWAYTEYRPRISQRESYDILMAAQSEAGFAFDMIQTDNGSEFGRWFHQMLVSRGLRLRHSRVRTPNDNAHLERFNRTVQEECIKRYHVAEVDTPAALRSYLAYYNNDRLHGGINWQTPARIVAKVLDP